MKKPSRAVIDGDLIAYRAASAVEDRYILVERGGNGRKKRFKTKTEFYGHYKKKSGGWLADLNKRREGEGNTPFLPEEFEITHHKEVEDVSHACQVAKQMIVGVLKKAGVDDYIVYLDGRENFRTDQATIVKYKGGRDTEKPTHLKAVEEYLCKSHKAVYSVGVETDDMISILSTTGKYMACTIDKDHAQCPSWWLDWVKMETPIEIPSGVGMLWIDTNKAKGKVRGVGFKHLMLQMLVGDEVDNIKPRHLCGVSYGDKSAYKLLSPLKTEEECLEAVLSLYKEWYPEEITYPHWDFSNNSLTMKKNYFGIASEIFTLLWMLRGLEDQTSLASECDRLGVEYTCS